MVLTCIACTIVWRIVATSTALFYYHTKNSHFWYDDPCVFSYVDLSLYKCIKINRLRVKVFVIYWVMSNLKWKIHKLYDHTIDRPICILSRHQQEESVRKSTNSSHSILVNNPTWFHKFLSLSPTLIESLLS